MSAKKNKVKFNICNVHYALITVDEDGEVTFGTPVAMPGAVSLSLEPNGEPSNFYADGYAYYTISNNMGYEGDLEKGIDKNDPENSNLDLFSLEMFENIAYVMAKHADPSIPDTPEEWLDSFNTFSIYQVLPQIIELWGLNTQTDVQAKKNFARLTGK